MTLRRGSFEQVANGRPLEAGGAVVPLQDFVGIQASVDAVLYHALAGLESEFLVVEKNLDLVRLEGDELGDARNLRPCLQVGPRGSFVVADVVVTGQALVGAE